MRLVFSTEKLEYLESKEDDIFNCISNSINNHESKTTSSLSITTINSKPESKAFSNLSLSIEDIYVEQDVMENFEINFIKNVFRKSILYYYGAYGDKHQVLFRREEANDDLIKSLFVLFGTNFANKTYDLLKNIIILTKENFVDFYHNLLQILLIEFPPVLKISLKLCFESVLEIYKIKSYEPLLVVLYFNFLFNPKVEDMSGLIITNEIVNDINKIINKICFNSYFNDNDKLHIYNSIIPELNEQTLKAMESMLDSVDKNMSKLLNEDVFKNGITPPSWLFYFDCDYILRLFDEITILESEAKEERSKTSLSFYVKVSKVNLKEIGDDLDVELEQD